MDVGSHTRTHVKLTESTLAEAHSQIQGSKQELELALGCAVNHFCYPYGWFSQEHRDMVAQAGYHTATTTVRGRVHPGADPFALNRIMVARATNLVQFAAKVMTGYEDRRT
jgi:peptidoglycan/xylan/chitin deacetylase (PgdA/CDA1 family)